MNILFVSPTWTDDLGIFANLAKKRNSQPPLGILYLAGIAEKRGHTVRIIDADVEANTGESLADNILANQYDLLGITVTSPIFHKAVELSKRLKSKGFNAPIVIGGEHLNIFKQDAFLPCFDYAFYGESDRTFEQFLGLLEHGSRDFTRMRGFIYRNEGQVIQTEPTEQITNLDQLNFPAMHLLKHDKYVMSFAKFSRRRYLPIMATRGCPFKCVFCSEPLTNPQVRFRSPENIVDEMERWSKEIGITHFFFMDSNLTLKRSQTEGLCNEILRRNLKITFEGWTRANLVDEEILTLLKKAGLIRISYGIESGDPEVLRIIKKEVSHEDMLNAFRITDALGIEPACSLMLGLPGDTRASVERSIEFVRSIPQILYSNFSIANPYPGTEMYKWALAGTHGIRLLIDDYSQFRRYDSSPTAVNDLSKEDLVRLQKIGLFRIHFTPRRMLAAVKMVGLLEIVPLFINFICAVVQSALSKKG
jgi:anaerobic magnesium-protoporphyrin IX monomethyl ester cyclase